MSELDRFPEISTERLILKQLTHEYLDPVFRHFSNDEINRFTDTDNAKSPEDAAELIQWGLGIFEKRFGILWGIFDKQEDTFLGEVNYVLRMGTDAIPHRVEIGYDLTRSNWGKGYMTEAFSAAIRYIFSLEHINRIEAVIHPDNLRSRKVVEQQGFAKEGILREFCVKNGVYWDMVMYSLLKREWQE